MALKALGLIEAIGLNTAIIAADAAVKSANVELLGYENGKGGGRITVKLIGDVGAVTAAIAAAAASINKNGQGGYIEATKVIARPHDEIEGLINEITRGKTTAKAQPEKKAEEPVVKQADMQVAPKTAPAEGSQISMSIPEVKEPVSVKDEKVEVKPVDKVEPKAPSRPDKPKGKK